MPMFGSSFSLIVMAAVAWGVKTVHTPSRTPGRRHDASDLVRDVYDLVVLVGCELEAAAENGHGAVVVVEAGCRRQRARPACRRSASPARDVRIRSAGRGPALRRDSRRGSARRRHRRWVDLSPP